MLVSPTTVSHQLFFRTMRNLQGKTHWINHSVLLVKDIRPTYHKGSQLETPHYVFTHVHVHRFRKPPRSENLKRAEAIQLYTHRHNTISLCYAYDTRVYVLAEEIILMKAIHVKIRHVYCSLWLAKKFSSGNRMNHFHIHCSVATGQTFCEVYVVT